MGNKAKYASDMTKLGSTDTPSDNYELNCNPTEKSEVVVSNNHLDVSEKVYLERRGTEKLKGKNNERRYFSNNNSIIELQQVDDKRYVTCKTRVIPNSECSSPKILKGKIDEISKKETEVSNLIAYISI